MLFVVNTEKCVFLFKKMVIRLKKPAGLRVLTFKGAELHQILGLAGCVAGFDTVSNVMELSVLED